MYPLVRVRRIQRREEMVEGHVSEVVGVGEATEEAVSHHNGTGLVRQVEKRCVSANKAGEEKIYV